MRLQVQHIKNKIMKKILIASLACVCLAACEDVVKTEFMAETENVAHLEVSLATTVSKSAAASDELAGADVQFFVFDASGALEGYFRDDENVGKASFRCVSGIKRVVAIVNGPLLSGVGSYEELRRYESDLLADNSPEALLMSGETSCLVAPGEESQQVHVLVARRVAKVVMNSIKVDFDVEHNGDKGFLLRSIYLVNVSGKTGCLHDMDCGVWYNKGALQTPGEVPLLYFAPQQEVFLEQGQSYLEPHAFYAYSNSCPDASGTPWSPRQTRLVVEAEIGSQLCYYPVTIPDLAAGHLYKVNLMVRHLGSGSADVPVEVLDVSGSVAVEEWTPSGDIYEEI